MDLRHLRYYVAVAETLHFHQAAENLNIAQPALSRTIKNLEEELGVTLLLRNNRSVEMTPAGRTLLEGARAVLHKTQKLVEDTQRVHDGKIGTLRVGYTDLALNGSVPLLLKTFRDQNPDIALLLSHTVTSQQIQGIEDGVFDFGIGTGPLVRSGIESKTLQREKFVCVVHERHRFARHRNLKVKELAQEAMVQGTASKWEYYHSYLQPIFRKNGFEPQVVQEAYTTLDVLNLVACGIGIAVLPETVANTMLPRLVAVPLVDADENLETVIIWHSDHGNGAMAHFIAFLKNTPLATASR